MLYIFGKVFKCSFHWYPTRPCLVNFKFRGGWTPISGGLQPPQVGWQLGSIFFLETTYLTKLSWNFHAFIHFCSIFVLTALATYVCISYWAQNNSLATKRKKLSEVQFHQKIPMYYHRKINKIGLKKTNPTMILKLLFLVSVGPTGHVYAKISNSQRMFAKKFSRAPCTKTRETCGI